MRKITLIVAVMALFTACANSQEEQKAATASPSLTQPIAESSSKNSIRKNRKNYTVSTSRAAKDIQQTFPYDIDLKKTDGSISNSSELLKSQGKPTVLLFWLTTCFPCKLELQAIEKKFDTWQAETDFRLVAISTDFSKNYGKFVERVAQNNWKWETYNDVNREFRQVMPGGLNGLPQTFILDKNGEVVYHKRKFRPGDEDILYKKIQEIAKK